MMGSIDPDDRPESLFFNDLNRLFYNYRVYTQGFAGLGDTTYSVTTEEGKKGMCVFSKSQGLENPDIVIFYIHGNAFSSASAFIYLEYMQRFIVTLQEQGFKSPVIFMPQIFDSKSFPKPLIQALLAWKYVGERYPNSKIVMGGDSVGATTAISLMILISQKMGIEAFNTELLRKPDGALLISPVTKFVVSKDEKGSDYLSKNLIKSWGEKYLQVHKRSNESNECFLKYLASPGLCNEELIWKEFFPPYGIVITYGSEEILAPDIEMFVAKLRGLGKLKVIKHNAHVHDWPIMTYVPERNVDDREESINLFSGIFSRMLLWETESYFEAAAKEPTNVIHIDDKFT